MNLAQLSEDNIRLFGEYPFLTFEGTVFTNTALKHLACRLAHGLRTLGVGPGQKVVVLMPNCPEVIVTFQAVLRLGATVIPVLFLLGPNEVRHILQDSEAAAVVTSTLFYDRVKEAANGVTTVKHVILTDAGPDDGTALSFGGLMESQPNDILMTDMDAHDVAVILYTSGTTGRPKGVMLTHLNLYANAKLAYVTAEFTRTDYQVRLSDAVSLLALPLAHSYGLVVMNVGFLAGARYILMPWFEPERAMQLIQEHRVTQFSGVPTMYAYMLHHPGFGQYDLSSVTSWGSGAAALPAELQKAFREKTGQPVYEGYGLSEYSPVVCTNRQDRPARPGSVGLPIFGTEVRIVDDEDRTLPAGVAGELVVRGPCVMKGYYRQPELTARVLRGGWLHTGDIARTDQDGYLFIAERKDDMIIRGGENIYPREVEEVLYGHPKVAEASVIGVPDPVMGQEVHAFVVPKPGQSVSETEVVEFCEGLIAKFKAPKRITFVPALPKNLIGKTLRKELRRMYQESHAPQPVR